MIKSEELSNPQSCINKALNDEPVFVFLGRDEAAPYAIRYWADLRVFKQKNKPNDEQITEAFALAKAMEDYRKSHL